MFCGGEGVRVQPKVWDPPEQEIKAIKGSGRRLLGVPGLLHFLGNNRIERIALGR